MSVVRSNTRATRKLQRRLADFTTSRITRRLLLSTCTNCDTKLNSRRLHDRSPCRSSRTAQRNGFPLSVALEQAWSDSCAVRARRLPYQRSLIGSERTLIYRNRTAEKDVFESVGTARTASNCCADRSPFHVGANCLARERNHVEDRAVG